MKTSRNLRMYEPSYGYARWPFGAKLYIKKANKETKKEIKFLFLNLFIPHCVLYSFYLTLWKVTITLDDNLLSMAVVTNYNLKDGEAFIWA